MIRVRNLSFSYTARPFIRGMSFEVRKAEVFGFLGPCGAGKSTLQKILTGLLTNCEGSVRVNGIEGKYHVQSFYEDIGVDFEFPCLYEKLTARENLRAFFLPCTRRNVTSMSCWTGWGCCRRRTNGCLIFQRHEILPELY